MLQIINDAPLYCMYCMNL